jgi:hypothetical protein
MSEWLSPPAEFATFLGNPFAQKLARNAVSRRQWLISYIFLLGQTLMTDGMKIQTHDTIGDRLLFVSCFGHNLKFHPRHQGLSLACVVMLLYPVTATSYVGVDGIGDGKCSALADLCVNSSKKIL